MNFATPSPHIPEDPVSPAAMASITRRDGCVARCPGCDYRALDACESEARKLTWLRGQLEPWSGCLAALQAPSGEERWHYRDRVCLSTAWQDGEWQFGLMRRGELIPIPRCPVHSRRVLKTVEALAGILPPPPVFPMVYLVQSGAQATLILKQPHTPTTRWLDPATADHLRAAGVEGLWLNLHPAAGRRLFARHGWRLLWGVERSRDRYGLIYGPGAFRQLIPALYARSLDEAEAFLDPAAGDVVIDLYCGSGASLARWCRQGVTVIGVELGGEAVDCARHNAPAATVLRGKCTHRIPQLDAWLGGSDAARAGRLLYANPPRTGLEPAVVQWVAETCRPRRLAYLSCSAGTLRRDLDRLCEAGYRVVRVAPYDFFPQTRHVETLVLLCL
jgi:23S rRNA (uracil1939-C5)-methyltransferase